MSKLYIYREYEMYHVGFHTDHICIASNIDEAITEILKNLNSTVINNEMGILKVKNLIKEFDLSNGYKKI
jgi:hypothetical protein